MKAILEQHDLMAIVANAGSTEDQALSAYEYDDSMDTGRSEFTKQCWIPAKPGSKFCIHYAWTGEVKSTLNEQAGLFCTLYIDELVVERAFLPLIDVNENEWEITGKYYRSPSGPAERPFKFVETPIDDDVDVLDTSDRGTIRLVLHWAEPNPRVENPFPDLSKWTADALALRLESPVSSENNRLQTCVRLGKSIESGVKENNMKVQAIDNQEYTFIFHYAHPAWLKNEGIIPPRVSRTYRTQANA